MGSGSIRNMPIASSRFSSGCMGERNIRGRGSGLRFAKRSWNVMADGSGWSQNLGKEPHSAFQYRCEAEMDKSIDQFGRPAEILLIEDNEGDIRLTQEVLKDGKVRNRLSVARDGEEAMA